MGNSIFKSFWRRRNVKVLFVGLDGAGKSMLLYRLKLGKALDLIPTVGYNVETIQHRHVCISCWDVGARDRTRTFVKHYLPGTDGLLFVVDSTDRERLNEAFTNVLEPITEEPSMEAVPILVLANKQDLENAMDQKELKGRLERSGHLKTHTWQVFGISAMNGLGINKALDWLIATIPKRDKSVTLKRSVSEPGIVTLDPRGGESAPVETKRLGVVSSIRRSIHRWW